VKRTRNCNRNPFGISESWDVWDLQIEQLKKRNDILAEVEETPEIGIRSGGGMSSSENEPKEGS
jgi:hypothetical protein